MHLFLSLLLLNIWHCDKRSAKKGETLKVSGRKFNKDDISDHNSLYTLSPEQIAFFFSFMSDLEFTWKEYIYHNYNNIKIYYNYFSKNKWLN